MAAGSPLSVVAEPVVSESRAAKVARPPVSGASVPLVAGARLPLVFIVGGLVAFGAAATWLARASGDGLMPFFHPQTVAVMHLWLPGFLLSVCFGATYQLMPVVLGTPLRARESWLWGHVGLHLAGVTALVWGLSGGHYAVAGLGGLAVSSGVVILGVAVARTFFSSRRRDAAAWSFVFSAGWLLATTLAGVMLALNRRDAFLSLTSIDLLRAHAHLGLVGYFASLLQGVTFQLVPMFTMGEARRPRIAMTGLLATQVGLPILAVGLAWGTRLPMTTGASVLAAGLVCTGVALAATLATRRRRRLDAGVRAFVVGLTLLGLGAVAGLFLTIVPLEPEWMLAGGATYGLVVIMGGLSLAVLGMLAKILPFLVWMKAYGPRVGREPVPVATALSSRRLEELWFGVHLTGLGGLLAGAIFDARWPATAGAALLATGAALCLGNAVRVLSHLRGRGSRPTPTSPSAAKDATMSAKPLVVPVTSHS